MLFEHLLAKISRVFPVGDTTLIVAALRQDQLIWGSLEPADFLDQALTRARQGAEALSPASLGMLAAGLELAPSRLRADPSFAPPLDLQQHAMQVWDGFLATGSAPYTLCSAGLFALALRERFRLAHSWQPLINETIPAPVALSAEADVLWKTGLACLFGMIAQPQDMLRAVLATHPARVAMPWVTHTILCQPVSLVRQAQSLTELIIDYRLAVQLQWLAYLQGQGRAELVRVVARMLLQAAQADPAIPQDTSDIDALDATSLADWASQLYQLAELNLAAGETVRGLSLLETARSYSVRFTDTARVKLTATSARSGVSNGDLPGVENLMSSISGSPALESALAAGLPLEHWQAIARNTSTDKLYHPLVQLRLAQSALSQGRADLAQERARELAPRLSAMFTKPDGLTALPSDWEPAEAVDLFLAVDMLPEARQFAAHLLTLRPTDTHLMASACLAFERCGDLPSAIEVALTQVTLSPADEAARLRLAGVCESAGDWESALEHREQLARGAAEKDQNAVLDLANCALHAGRPQRALDLCAQVLESEPDQGRAHAIKGLALMTKGSRAEAIQHLDRATLLAPEEAAPWLSLAEIQRETGDVRRELETLRAAVLAAPESAELHFALATSCLDNYLPSEALPALREAQRRKPDSIEITNRLVETLYQLGHEKEARQQVDMARRRWPQNAALAIFDAKMHADSGNLSAAVPAVEVALGADNPDPAWYLLYAQALVDYRADRILSKSPAPGRLAKAQQALRQCCDQFSARVLLAEVLYLQGEHQAALEFYRELVDAPEASSPQWDWRVQAGLGRVAIATGQIGVALAAFREAVQAQPENLPINRLLAEAYQSADLPDEAAQAANRALSLAPSDFDTLSWFIAIMSAIGKEDDTLDALITATQLAPDKAALWNQLARLQVQGGEVDQAHQSLAALLAVEGLDAAALRQAAHTYQVLGDPAAALDAIERALIVAGPSPSAALLAEAAVLRARRGTAEAALDLVTQAVAMAPREPVLLILQADLEVMLGQPELAWICLEQADNLNNATPARIGTVLHDWLPDAWGRLAQAASAIAVRRALIEAERGNLAFALQFAEQGLVQEPANLALRFFTADLSLRLLDPHKAVQLAALPELQPGQSSEWLQALVGLQADLFLQAGEEVEAGKIIETYAAVGQEHVLVLAVRTRLLSRIGQYGPAAEAYQALAEAIPVVPSRLSDHIFPSLDIDTRITQAVTTSRYLAAAEAALDLQQWDDTLKRFRAIVSAYPADARAQLGLVRALVIQAEQQTFCEELSCQTHAPGKTARDAARLDEFEQAAATASRYSQAPVVHQWLVRGRAAFHPCLQNAPELARIAPSAENAAALLEMLRASNHSANAVRIAHHFPYSPASQAQLALCNLDLDPQVGLDLARKAAVQQPFQPLYQVVLARLAEKAGQVDEAIPAITAALNIWPDEPCWHAWAARLHQQIDEDDQAIQHLETCLALSPASVEAALVLAELYLDHHEVERAEEVLESAARVDPDNAKVWLALANAHRMAGDLDAALDAAEKAGQIEPDSPSPLLAAGEIALQMGRSDQALELARCAANTGPADEASVLFLARVLVQKGSLTEALTVLEKALGQLEINLPVMLEHANLIHRLNGSQAALPAYLELAQHFPEEVDVLTFLAQAQADSGDKKAAERTAYAALHLDPERPQLNVLLGHIQHTAGQLDQAIHFFSEAVRLEPTDIENYLDLGQAYQDRREHLQALRTYQQAIKISPRDYRPYYHAALVLRESKDYPGAESMLRRAAELDPEDLNIRRQLGAVVALNLVHYSQEANAEL